MGAQLEAVAGCRPGPEKTTAAALAVAAGQACLTGGPPPADVGLLVYTGVFRDDNVCEPATALFVQQQLGLNTGPEAPSRTFAFDLSNGSCGFLDGLRVANGLLQGSQGCALVLTSDVDPCDSSEFTSHWTPAGAGVLIKDGTPQTGLVAFATRRISARNPRRSAVVAWDDARGTHHLSVEPGRDVPVALQYCVDSAVEELLAAQGLDSDQVGLVVADQHVPTPSGFGEERMIRPSGPPVFTAGLPLALERAMADPRWGRAGLVLLIAAGTGPTVSVALYRPAP